LLIIFAADGEISGDFFTALSGYIPRYRVLWEYGKNTRYLWINEKSKRREREMCRGDRSQISIPSFCIDQISKRGDAPYFYAQNQLFLSVL